MRTIARVGIVAAVAAATSAFSVLLILGADADAARPAAVALLAGLTAGIILARWAGRAADEPFARLAERADRIRAGDGTAQADLGASGAAGRLGAAFDAMVQQLQALHADAKRRLADAQAEAVLSQRTLARAHGVLREATWEWHPGRDELRLSPAWSDLLGLATSELPARLSTWSERVHAEDQALVTAALREVADGKRERIDLEHRVRHESGGHRWIAIGAQRAADGDNAWVVGAARDVTERRATEAALGLARDQLKAATQSSLELIESLGRELDARSAPLQSGVERLVETRLDERQAEVVAGLRSAATQLLGLVNDVIDFARLEAGTLRLDETSFDPRLVADEALERVVPRAHAHDTDLAVEVDPGVPVALAGDAGRVRQLILGLLMRAADATQSGEITLSVGGKDLPEGRFELQIWVKDTGHALAALGDDVYRPFTGAQAGARGADSNGLRLAIARRLVDRMKGRIGFETREGRGTTFHVALTLATVPAPARRPDAFAARIKGRRALIVVVRPEARRILRARLERWGMEVAEADSVASAVDALGKGRAAAVLLDQSLGGDGPVAAARELRAATPGQHVPLLLLARHGERIVDDHPPLFDAALLKPARAATLGATLASFVDRDEIVGRPEVRAATPARIRPLKEPPAEPPAPTKANPPPAAADPAAAAAVATPAPAAAPPAAPAKAKPRRKKAAAPAPPPPPKVLIPEPKPLASVRTPPITVKATPAAPTAPAAGLGSPLDARVLHRLRIQTGSHKAVADLIKAFFDEAPLRIAELRGSLASSDARGVERAAHGLKSSSVGLGASQLAQLCLKMESMGRNKELEDANRLITEIEAALRNAKRALEVERARVMD